MHFLGDYLGYPEFSPGVSKILKKLMTCIITNVIRPAFISGIAWAIIYYVWPLFRDRRARRRLRQMRARP